MSELKPVRAGLDVGFAGGEMPHPYAALKGRAWRSIPLQPEFPFEDAQFDAVVMSGEAVSRVSAKEAHRVLKPEGRLYFTVPEKNGSQEGFALPDIYAIVREGFNIVDVQLPRWWHFRRQGRSIGICAQKKNWRHNSNNFRPSV